MRYLVYGCCVVLTLLSAALLGQHPLFLYLLLIAGALALVGTYDLLQPWHSLRRNFPILAHARWMAEAVRPELRQYLFESDTDGTPFTREERSLVYQRAKSVNDKRPFGTELNVYAPDFEWINHSICPSAPAQEPFRITVGGPDCTHPYSASVFNISAMSFGSLSANAIRALNCGAKIGNFAHDTGEGGVSPHHREHGGDLIWEIGSGYFGCRDAKGRFDPGRFAETARLDQVKMVEIKLSQGAKPGHGGVLPAAKITEEISRIRGVPMGQDCISPSAHAEFLTPVQLLEFLARMRELSGGKPAGFKLCIGHRIEFLAIIKAMRVTGIRPDFIVVDGKEGGTGAAPLELTNNVGTPLREGLLFVHNALVGTGMREHIRVAASGKVVTGFRLAGNLALGADWCNAARGFMFALGCVQSQSCHTDRCPTGVATQDPLRQRALSVTLKSQRVANFHRHTLSALAEIIAAAGLSHPKDLRPEHLCRRTSPYEMCTAAQSYRFLKPGELLLGDDGSELAALWRAADPGRFTHV